MSGVKPTPYQKVALQEQALSPAQRAEILAKFKKHDKDNSGTIDKVEFRALLEESLGRKLSDLLFSKYLDLQFHATDKDFNGHIDFAEFASLYSKIYTNPELPIGMGSSGPGSGFGSGKQRPLETGANAPKVEKKPELILSSEEVEAARQKFKEFDKDNSGTIDKSELKALLMATSTGKKMSPTMVERYVAVQFSLWDKDKSGSIDFNEFQAVYAKFWAESQQAGVSDFSFFYLPSCFESSTFESNLIFVCFLLYSFLRFSKSL
jgi:Ca2+-binding EF-hand superfamily protein